MKLNIRRNAFGSGRSIVGGCGGTWKLSVGKLPLEVAMAVNPERCKKSRDLARALECLRLESIGYLLFAQC